MTRIDGAEEDELVVEVVEVLDLVRKGNAFHVTEEEDEVFDLLRRGLEGWWLVVVLFFFFSFGDV